MRKTLLRYWFIWVGLGSIFMSSLYAYIPYFVVEVKNPIIMSAKYLIDDQSISSHKKDNHKNITVTSFDNTLISGKISKSKIQPARAYIILLHGIRSDKNMMIAQEDFFTKNGFNTLSIDLRGHGLSGGEYCTYGFKEKKDISAVIDFLQKEKNWKKPIGIFGHSLGGAVALQAMAYDPRISFGIIESTYSNFSKISSDYSEYYTGLTSDLLNEDILERSAEIAGFKPDKVNPSEYCTQITQPVFIVHGKEDQKIKPDYAHENFSKLSSSYKELLFVEKAHHNDIWQVGGDKYHKKILNFLSKINKK